MKNILFVAVNSSWSQSNLALYYLREMLYDLPYNPEMLVFSTKEPVMQCVEEIYRHPADLLCFSAYIWNRVYLESLLKILRQLLPHATFVIGGPEAGAFSDFPLSLVVQGPGEGAFRALAESGFATSNLPGSYLPLAQVPFPYQPGDLQQLEDHLLYYECYRGCPYSCVYCLSSCDMRKESRFDMSRAEDRDRLRFELDSLMAFKPRTLKFIDRSFNINKDLAHYIWTYAMQDESNTDFHFEIYPDLVDETDLALLDQAPLGKIRFEIGIQTTNAEVAAACGRRSDWQKSRNVLLRLKESGKIRVHADLLVGLPSEGVASILNSLDALCECEPAAVQLGLLKILPDTPMLDIARLRGYKWMQDPPYQVLQTDALSFDDICALDDFAHLLSLYWNKEEYKAEWHALLQKNKASTILSNLKQIHQELNMPLHSVAKAKRQKVMDLLSP